MVAAQSHGDSNTLLGSNRIFTTLSLLALITQPLDLIFAYVPEILAGVACFTRIENYLRQKPDSSSSSAEQAAPTSQSPETLSHKSSGEGSNADGWGGSNSEKQQPPLPAGDAVRLQDAAFGWSKDAGPVLPSLNLRVPSRCLTMVVGPIASGKSTLLKGILGETPLRRGVVQLATNTTNSSSTNDDTNNDNTPPSRSVAFCDQKPWLANETLRANVIGFSHFDAAWYATVIRACALEEDFQQFPEGDQIVIGSNGLSLSGGQKQRVVRGFIAPTRLREHPPVLTQPGNRTSCLLQAGLDLVRRRLQWSGPAHAVSHRPRGLRPPWPAESTRRHLHIGDTCRYARPPHPPSCRLDPRTRLTATLVHLLDHADFIIGLDANGTVVENGPREDVTKKQDYLTKLGIEPVKDESTAKETQENPKEAEFAPAAAVNDSLNRTVDEATQRLGDGSVYKYYFGTFGWPKTFVFFALQTILVFCLKFPGKYYPRTYDFLFTD